MTSSRWLFFVQPTVQYSKLFSLHWYKKAKRSHASYVRFWNSECLVVFFSLKNVVEGKLFRRCSEISPYLNAGNPVSSVLLVLFLYWQDIMSLLHWWDGVLFLPSYWLAVMGGLALAEIALLLALLGVREPALRVPAFFLKTLMMINKTTHTHKKGGLL